MPQYISKLILNGVTQMDVTQDTVAANNLLQGETATKNDGSPVTGTYVPITPTGNINITQAGVIDVTNYATATVPSADPWIEIDEGFFTESDEYKFRYKGIIVVEESEGDTAGYLPDGYRKSSEWVVRDAIPANTTVTPSKSAQTIGGAYTMMAGAVTVAAVPEMDFWEGYIQRNNYETINGQRYWKPTCGIQAFNSGWIDAGTYGEVDTFPAVAANTTITPTTSAQTIGGANTMMEGAVTVAAMPSGSATPAATISGTSATVSTGTNTLTLSKTVSNTPQVSAGYVSSGTAGNSNVSLTANVTTKAAATYHPSSSQQTIASGTYLTGTQTINAVTTTNLTADNIKSGVVVQVGDSSDPDCVTSVTGTYTGGGGSGKATYIYNGLASRTANSYGATNATVTVTKAGTYNISYVAIRGSSSGTMGTNLHIGSTAGTNNTTWNNGTYGQYVQQTNKTISANQAVTIYATSGSNSRTIYVGMLIVEEV